MREIQGVDDARRLILQNLSPRSLYLAQLESYVEGTQYEGLRPWDDPETPLRERAPCIVYLLAKAAIESNEDLLLGDHRFPELTTNPGEDDDTLDDDDGEGLSEEGSEYVDRVIAEVVRVAKVPEASREIFGAAQACGTAVAILGARGSLGKLFVDTVPAKWCTRNTDRDGKVTRLAIQYPYEKHWQGSDGSWHTKAMLYRRVIDAESDTTMIPIEARNDAPKEEEWRPDPEQTYAHGLGFCPVVWYAHMQGCATVEQIDGKALHRMCLDEIRELDYSLSTRHGAAIYTGAPQLVEIGVEGGFNPSEKARPAHVPGTPSGGDMSSANRAASEYRVRTSSTVRKKGVSIAWQYPKADAKVSWLTLDPGAVEVIDKDAHDIRQKIAEMLCVVFMDPENIKFAASISAKAIEILLGRQLNRVDKYRDDFGDSCLVPIVAMLLRIVCKLTSTAKSVALRGRKKLVTILGDGGAAWVDPMIVPKWGPYFKQAADDQSKVVDGTIKAKAEGLITLRTAVERVAPIFGIENVDQYVEALEAEAEQAQTKALEMREAMGVSKGMSDEEGSEDEDEEPNAPKSTGVGKAKPKPTS